MKKILRIILCIMLMLALMITSGCVNNRKVKNAHRKHSDTSMTDNSQKKEIPDDAVECEECGGTGRCSCVDEDGDCSYCQGTEKMECAVCEGSGECTDCYGNDSDCYMCDGSGECEFCDDGEAECEYCFFECGYCNDTQECASCGGSGYYYIDDYDTDYDDYDYDDYDYDDYDYDDECYYCDGDGIMECPYCNDGNCNNCGGLGYYITTTLSGDCTQCTNGNCSYCGGTEEMECTYCR